MKKVNAREWIAAICDAVEDILSEYGIQIPDEGRKGEENEACLYGHSYDLVSDSVQNCLRQKLKQTLKPSMTSMSIK